MNPSERIKITYIHHSCFLAETPEANFVFDFYSDPTVAKGKPPRFAAELDRDKPLFVLVSHHHKDHYSKQIFEWSADFPEIHYILSRDTALFCRHILSPTSIYAGPKPAPGSVTTLRPGESFTCCGVTVRAFGSTDLGNSYLIETPSASFFHAGDLNAWIWKDESTPDEVNEALTLFRKHIADIKKHLGSAGIDYAFFPVDSRIGSDYWTGAAIFLSEFNVVHFFPMHFGLGDPQEQLARRLDAARFELYLNPGFPTMAVGPLEPYGVFSAPCGKTQLGII